VNSQGKVTLRSDLLSEPHKVLKSELIKGFVLITTRTGCFNIE
jgi:hypothetical protein